MLRAIIHLDPYTFEEFAGQLASEGTEAPHNDIEGLLFYALDKTPDEDLNEFALRLTLFGHRDIPRDGEIDYLAAAEIAFITPKPKKQALRNQPRKKPTLMRGAKAKKSVAKKKSQPNRDGGRRNGSRRVLLQAAGAIPSPAPPPLP